MMLTYLVFLDTKEEKEQFILLYKVYYPLLYFVAYRICKEQEKAEDAVHDTFLKLTNHLDCISTETYRILKKFLKEQKRHPELSLAEYLEKNQKNKSKHCHKTWNYLVTILKNIIYDQFRKEKSRLEYSLSDYIPYDRYIQKGPEDQYIENDTKELLKRTILQLKDPYREVLFLIYYQEYSPKEIGEILGKSADNIRHIAKRGREKLRELLEKEGYSL